ncbi:efflux RND transporter permease subunit, partial [Acidobacteriota bacterium]
VRSKLDEFPGVFISLGQPISHRLDHLLSGVEAQLAIKIYGERLHILRQKAEEVRAVVGTVPGVTDLFVEPQIEIPKLRIDLDREDMAFYGLTAEQVVDFVNAAFNGVIVGQVIYGPAKYDVVVKLSDEQERDIDQVMDLQMVNLMGEYIPLRELAYLRKDKGPSTIMREDLSRRVVIQCNTAGRDLGSMVAQIQKEIKEQVELPEGYRIDYGGQFKSQRRAMGSLTFWLVVISAGIFFLLFIGLGSIRLSLVVMLNLPLALAGGVASVALTGGVLSVSSAVGFILLFGIAIRNGIILVGHINNLRREGLDLQDAVRQGASERLSPVLMTALSTGLGMLPLALAAGSGAEIQKPLAIVILGGMLTSTLLTLIVIPAVYTLVEQTTKTLRGET